LGKNGRVHVAWNGSSKAQPKNPFGHSPMLYTRLHDAGTAFEPQRNLMQVSDLLDGGGTVAADSAGNVYVAWHGVSKVARGEVSREVWLAHSTDEGKTFGQETAADRSMWLLGHAGLYRQQGNRLSFLPGLRARGPIPT
jgi:hypothetical protein